MILCYIPIFTKTTSNIVQGYDGTVEVNSCTTYLLSNLEYNIWTVNWFWLKILDIFLDCTADG